MYELYPYFTNDGSVGLFSRRDDDIYHSTYGALTESWQKFILPAKFENYIKTHSSVKILDICYGIGYNTKTALNVFIKNYKINSKKYRTSPLNIATIDADNIRIKKNRQNHNKKENLYSNKEISTEEIYSDNIPSVDSEQLNKNNSYLSQNIMCNNLQIDAVDLDKFLINISPFIINASWQNFLHEKALNDEHKFLEDEIKYKQVKNIKNFKKIIKKELRLTNEVSIILLM